MITGVVIYPETLLVLIKERKTVTTESEKDRMFPEVTIYVILCGEYVQVHKVMKSFVSML